MTKRILPMALRAYAEPETPFSANAGHEPLLPSRWSLVFDCETTTHLDQELRFGFYRIYRRGDDGTEELRESGAFSGTMSGPELDTLRAYCDAHSLKYRTLLEFVEQVFYVVCYQAHGQCIGFNLPFDLSRMAQRWVPCRSRMMAGGWTFFLVPPTGDPAHDGGEDWNHPPVQIRSLGHNRAFIRFRGDSRPARSEKNRGVRPRPYRGHFCDVHTLAQALLGSSFSLADLSELLGVEHRKLDAKHGGKLTVRYLQYAERDPLATWECFLELRRRLRASGLQVEPSALYSEAGVAKAILRQLGIKPWRQVQPKFPANLLGIIWSTYYAGRSELRLRHTVAPAAYLDFTSQYPTVAALMDIWRFVIADGVEWSDCTDWARENLEWVTFADLLKPAVWPLLNVLVELEPDGDVLPVRAPYQAGDVTIGENKLTSEQPVWYTLAHAIASKLRTGKAPKVRSALRFTPGPIQDGLKPIDLFNALISPTDDLYVTLINHRHELRKQGLDHEQLAVKLAANSLASGIFAEVQASNLPESVKVKVHSNGQCEEVRTYHEEKPGDYYHPLLATFVTGGGRLLLAMLEYAAQYRGLDWAMCDTDSMTLVMPEGDAIDLGVVEGLMDSFEYLNPYNFAGLLKLEHMADFFGVSAKRYALSRETLIVSSTQFVKVSGHALGYLASPVDPWPRGVELSDAAPWHVDVWREVRRFATYDGRPPRPEYGRLPGAGNTAMMHYAITRPTIEDWLPLRPFTFLTVMMGRSRLQADGDWKEIKPIAPFTRTASEAESLAVDRITGEQLGRDVAMLATYADVLQDFHVHPESKFSTDPHAAGFLDRCMVTPDGFTFVGKEANLADERALFGSADVSADIEYLTVGAADSSWRQAFSSYSLSEVAKVTGLSKGYVSRLLSGERRLTPEIRETFRRALRELTPNG